MSTTFQGTDEEWRALESAFLDLDPKLNVYCLANGLDLLKNHSGFPDRTLEWYSDGMERRASVVAEPGSPARFTLWADASRKQDGTPLAVRLPVGEPIDLDQLRDGLIELLEGVIAHSDRISREELSPSGSGGDSK